jgi:hypothetical protein
VSRASPNAVASALPAEGVSSGFVPLSHLSYQNITASPAHVRLGEAGGRCQGRSVPHRDNGTIGQTFIFPGYNFPERRDASIAHGAVQPSPQAMCTTITITRKHHLLFAHAIPHTFYLPR